MEPTRSGIVLAILEDLFFTVKIQAAAKQAGFESVFVKNEELAFARLKQNVSLVLVDLNSKSLDPIAFVQRLKASPDIPEVPVVGYVSHVQVDLRQAAEKAGFDIVLARSALSSNLPEILRTHAARQS